MADEEFILTDDPEAIDDLAMLEEANTRLMEQDGGLSVFLEEAWKIIEPSPTATFKGNWHVDAICEFLEAITRGDITNGLITMPPRHLKSIIAVVMWPCWEWGPMKMAYTRWIFSSYAQSLSMRDSQKRRRIMAHPWFKDRWGDIFTIGGDIYATDSVVKYENSESGFHLATSVKGSNTGEGGDRIICDDAHNVKEVHSDTVRQSTVDWWFEVMSTRRNDPKASARLAIMQRSHEMDLAGGIVQRGGVVHLNLPAIYEGVPCVIHLPGKVYEEEEPPFFEDPRSQKGELLHEERFGPVELESLKIDLGAYAFAGQFQQQPSPSEGGIVKKKWWRYHVPQGHELAGTRDNFGHLIVECPLQHAFHLRLHSWDMAYKDHDDTDYVVGTAWGRYMADSYLLEMSRKQMGFVDSKRAVLRLLGTHPAERVLVEAKANGPAIVDELCRTVPGMMESEPEGSKASRLQTSSVRVEAGNYYLPHPSTCAWTNDFIHEIAIFPNGANDDQADSFTQADRWLYIEVDFDGDNFGSPDI